MIQEIIILKDLAKQEMVNSIKMLTQSKPRTLHNPFKNFDYDKTIALIIERLKEIN